MPNIRKKPEPCDIRKKPELCSDKANRFTCPALRETIKDKEIAEVMSNELMATIRNNSYIPYDRRFKLIDQIDSITKQETEIKKQIQDIEKSLNCSIPEERIAGMTLKQFLDIQRRVYIATSKTEPSKEYLESTIPYAKYMEIIEKRRDDPRVLGNR